MSYPKKGPQSIMGKPKREQLKNLLINKFRTKFNVRGEIDAFDEIIKNEIDILVAQNDMTEANLNKLDRHLNRLHRD